MINDAFNALKGISKGATSMQKLSKIVAPQLGMVSGYLAGRINKITSTLSSEGNTEIKVLFLPSFPSGQNESNEFLKAAQGQEHNFNKPIECLVIFTGKNGGLQAEEIEFKTLVFGGIEKQVNLAATIGGLDGIDSLCDQMTTTINLQLLKNIDSEHQNLFCYVHSENEQLVIDLCKGQLSNFEVIKRLDNKFLIGEMEGL